MVNGEGHPPHEYGPHEYVPPRELDPVWFEPGAEIRHSHGQHGPHTHTGADYAGHQQPIDGEHVHLLDLPMDPDGPYADPGLEVGGTSHLPPADYPQSGSQDFGPGVNIQVDDWPVVHLQARQLLHLAIDGEGSGRTVGEWLALAERQLIADKIIQNAEAPQPAWSLRLELVRALAEAEDPVSVMEAAKEGTSWLFAVAEPTPTRGRVVRSDGGPDLDYGWVAEIAGRTRIDAGLVALVLGAHFELVDSRVGS